MKILRCYWILLLCPLLMGSMSNAPNPNEDQTLNLSSQQFGLYGPLAVNFQYSKELGTFVQAKFTQLINPFFATSLDLETGENTRRINGTFGYLLTPKQRVKLSGEYLTQNLDFDFATGDVKKWIGQDAYGLTYEYLLPKGWLRSFGFNTFYSKSQSKNLSTKTYQDGSGAWYQDFRHIAGAVDKHGGLDVNLLPTKLTLLDLELSYDYLKYNRYYASDHGDPGENNSGLGFSINLQQLISNRFKLQLLTNDIAAYQDYEAELDWLMPSMLGTKLELGLNGKRLMGNHGLQNDTQFGVNVNFRWGLKKTRATSGYNVDLANNFNDLAAWTADPAVYMQEVLAVKDEYQKAMGPDPFANPDNLLNNMTIPYGHFFTTSYKALDLFVDPLQSANSLVLKAQGEEVVGLHDIFTPDPNNQDNGTITFYGLVDEQTAKAVGDDGIKVTIYARNYKDAPDHWSSSTQQFRINLSYTNPVVDIPAQIFHLGDVVNKNLRPYIRFNSNKLSSVEAASLTNYGLQINLSNNGKQVTLTGTANKAANNENIPITVTNSANKTTHSSFKLTITANAPIIKNVQNKVYADKKPITPNPDQVAIAQAESGNFVDHQAKIDIEPKNPSTDEPLAYFGLQQKVELSPDNKTATIYLQANGPLKEPTYTTSHYVINVENSGGQSTTAEFMLDVRGAPKVTDADLGNGAADPGATIKPEIDLSKHFQNTTPSTDTMSYSVDSEPKGISATINGDQLATIQVDNNVVPADYAINIHAKNNHSGDYSGDAIYHLTVNKPATLTCPEPDTQFHYDQQYCAQHPDGKVDYYGESGGYKFELAPYFIVYHCDTIPKPGELKFFSAYITRNSPGPTLVCRYNFSGSETDWYTVKRLPANSNFHNYATQDDCGSLSDHKTIEECKVDLKG